ncbi:MAG TPA: extracellular solute-binding protein, partial [Spirochaetia bacterium]|nr:extracellular solute-binding protein [Spirochaetia bacterium]
MKKRSLILFFLIVFPVLLFAGGTKEEKAAPEPSQAAQKMTPIQKYNPGFKFPTEKIELSYWHSLQTRPGYHELALKLAEEYSAIHPNVSISIRDVPNAQQRAIWSAAFEGKSAPDVAWIEAQVGLMAKTLRKSPAWAVKMMEESFTPYALSLSKVGKDYFGWAGCEIDAGQMLYYRKDFFRQNGLDPEKPPEFLPDWLEAAKRLTKFDASGKMTVAGVAVRYAGGQMGVGD